MPKFFIERPIFAIVISLLIMLVGGITLHNMAVEQYPPVSPPAVQIRASFPGASAETMQNTVIQVIEQQMTGIDNMLYMSSSSDETGQSTTTLTFAPGTDPDIAQVQVQNQLQAAVPRLPRDVQNAGLRVSKSTSDFLMVAAFVSDNDSMSKFDIANYVASNVQDPLSRIPGVGSMNLFGTQYAMRIWLDPVKLTSYALTPLDVNAAIEKQNVQVSGGQLGGLPAVPGQTLSATINQASLLRTPEQFERILLKVQPDGSSVRIKDVARVALGPENYNVDVRYNGKPASGLGIQLGPDANALDTADAVRARLKELSAFFPEGLRVVYPNDITPFIEVSIHEVVKTLIEGIVLVFLVMYLFLQNFRATLIPSITVPVVLLGTFGIMSALGFTINTLSMFGLVLAIGLLVDDAIVVVENVERIMAEEGLSPLEAARKSMTQITGALVGIGVVLSAVFVPMAFMSGSTGIIYRQFSATIVAAMALSVLVAIVLTPALCATMLKPIDKDHHAPRRGFFGWFNRAFDRGNARYQRGVQGILQRGKRFMLIFAGLFVVMGVLFLRMPSSFLPSEDQGVLFAMIQGPVGATQERTIDTIKQVEHHFLENEKGAVQSVFSVQGFSFAGMGQNNGISFVKLRDWSERTDKELSVDAVAGRAMGAFGQIKDSLAFAFAPPAITELGTASGFNFFLQDNANLGHDALLQARNQLLAAAAESKLLTNVRPNGQEDTPQLRVEVDKKRAAALGVQVADINATLSTAWGGQYIDDFIDRGRVKRVYVQADAPYRMTPEDFKLWSVRATNGEMVPFSSFASMRWEYGSQRLERYNGVSAMEIQGEGKLGVSSGEAMAEIERIAATLPAGFNVEWTALSYQERQAGSQTTMLYTVSLLIVFLCLAALYESWNVPTAVLMVAPLGILGTVLANTMAGMSRDVYFQVAMLTTVGLTSKNAILIVEFAKANLESGMELVAATMQAVRDRLRPIIMTSLAFGLGVLPLALASGAGSGAQRAIGTGVVGGMVVGTLLGVFFIPLFYVVVQRLFGQKKAVAGSAAHHSATHQPVAESIASE